MKRISVAILARMGDFRNLFISENWVSEFSAGHDYAYIGVIALLFYGTVFSFPILSIIVASVVVGIYLWYYAKETLPKEQKESASLGLRRVGVLTCFVIGILVFSLAQFIILKIPKSWS